MRARFRFALTLISIAAVVMVLAPPGGAQTLPLTLNECVRLALAAPSAVTVAQLERDIADSGRRIARAGFLPQGSLSVDHLYNSPLADDPATPTFLPSDAVRQLSTLATVVQSVDVSGRLRAEYARARANQDIAGANLAIAERNLERGVAAAYYQLVLSRRIVTTLETTVAEAMDFENRVMLLVDAGEAARSDLVKATAQSALFRRQLSTARLDAELANQQLAAFWTDDVTPRLEIVDVLDEEVEAPPSAVPASASEDAPYRNRPEFRLLDSEQRGFEADARRARAGLMPDLQLAFQWGVDREVPGWSLSDRGYAVFASLNLNLFDWSRTQGQVQQAEERADQVAATRSLTTRQFSREYQSALARVRDIFEQISLARIQMTAAEEDLRLSRVRYEGGEGPALEVVTAQSQLAEARSAYYAAVTGYLNASRDLEVASGQ
jgi:outer membrane protein